MTKKVSKPKVSVTTYHTRPANGVYGFGVTNKDDGTPLSNGSHAGGTLHVDSNGLGLLGLSFRAHNPTALTKYTDVNGTPVPLKYILGYLNDDAPLPLKDYEKNIFGEYGMSLCMEAGRREITVLFKTGEEYLGDLKYLSIDTNIVNFYEV